MDRRMALSFGGIGLMGLLMSCRRAAPTSLSSDEMLRFYGTPPAIPPGPQTVFHLGHSLVGRDMPAMVAQLAGAGHVYHSQLGWGASLKNHWDDDISGFAEENAHPAARPVRAALDRGIYDAVVLTEMVEIRAAIRYHQSTEYLRRWAQRARQANPDVRLYFYESWPVTDHEEGWLERVDKDLSRHWEDEILIPALRADRLPIYVIPGGQALAATVRAILERGSVDGVSGVNDLFGIGPDGIQDTIHPNDLGTYVVALTHYSVLYQASPVGMPFELKRANGDAATAPGPTLAALMQQTVWDVVTSYEKTGVRT